MDIKIEDQESLYLLIKEAKAARTAGLVSFKSFSNLTAVLVKAYKLKKYDLARQLNALHYQQIELIYEALNK